MDVTAEKKERITAATATNRSLTFMLLLVTNNPTYMLTDFHY
jgi:hypothetical protein